MFEDALQLRIDPWATEYGSAIQLEEEVEGSPAATPESVKTDVELEDWEPVTPAEVPRPERIAFVDGVQQIEARVTAEAGAATVYGAFASVGAGATVASGTEAVFAELRVRRVLALSNGGEERIRAQSVSDGLVYEPYSSELPGYNGVAAALNGRRSSLEAELCQLLAGSVPLVVLDGRLRLNPVPGGAVVGFVKTLHKRYLGPPHAEVLFRLEAGQRTPVFVIRDDAHHPVYSWYLRLSPRRAIDHPLAGVVRVETPEGAGSTEAVRLANQTARYLPAFASTPERDPRAPQNLLPIGGLEARLRHEMGEQQWIRRSIEAHLHRQPTMA